MMKKILLSLTMILIAMSSQAALTKQAQGAWFESCWMEFTGLSSSYSHYNAYISNDHGTSWTQLDGDLIRSYGSYGRVDAVGLAAGEYQLKVVPVASGAEVAADATLSDFLSVRNFDRKLTLGVGLRVLERSNLQLRRLQLSPVGCTEDRNAYRDGERS